MQLNIIYCLVIYVIMCKYFFSNLNQMRENYFNNFQYCILVFKTLTLTLILHIQQHFLFQEIDQQCQQYVTVFLLKPVVDSIFILNYVFHKI